MSRQRKSRESQLLPGAYQQASTKTTYNACGVNHDLNRESITSMTGCAQRNDAQVKIRLDEETTESRSLLPWEKNLCVEALRQALISLSARGLLLIHRKYVQRCDAWQGLLKIFTKVVRRQNGALRFRFRKF